MGDAADDSTDEPGIFKVRQKFVGDSSGDEGPLTSDELLLQESSMKNPYRIAAEKIGETCADGTGEDAASCAK